MYLKFTHLNNPLIWIYNEDPWDNDADDCGDNQYNTTNLGDSSQS